MCGAVSRIVFCASFCGLTAGAVDWSSSRHDAHNTAAVVFSAAPAHPLGGWSYSLREQLYGYQPAMAVWSSPALGEIDGRPVVAAGACDHRLYLFDALSGEILWRHLTGGGIYSAPLIWRGDHETAVYFASSDRSVYALAARDGRRRWSRELVAFRPALGYSRLTAPAAGESGGARALFVGYWVYDSSLAGGFQEAALVCLDAATGRELWRSRFLDHRLGDPLFYRAGGKGVVFIASADGNLRALEADRGRLLWTYREMQPILSSPLVFEGTTGPRLVIGGHLGQLRCLDALSGELVWSFSAGSWIAAPAALAEADGRRRVLFGTYQSGFFALDAESGRMLWRQPTAAPVYSAPTVIADEGQPQVVYAAWDHRLYSLALEDGRLRWTFHAGRPLWEGLMLGDSFWGSPAAARTPAGWMIYFGSYGGVFHGLPLSQAAQGTGSRPLDNLNFLLALALTVILTVLLALFLTRRRRGYNAGHGPER